MSIPESAPIYLKHEISSFTNIIPNWEKAITTPVWQITNPETESKPKPIKPECFVPDLLLSSNFTNPFENFNNWFKDCFILKFNFPIFTPFTPQVDNISNNENITETKNKPKSVKTEKEMFNKFMEYVLDDEGKDFHMDGKNPSISGIQKKWYDANMGKTTTLEEFKTELADEEKRKEYYYKFYWVPSGAKKLAEQGQEKLAYILFDTALHSGFEKSKELLRSSGNDAEKMLALRTDFLKNLNNGKSWAANGGWADRMEQINERFDSMA